jgi:hypothetical protein
VQPLAIHCLFIHGKVIAAYKWLIKLDLSKNSLFLSFMKAAKHIVTIMLALLMIVSSTGLTLAAHICKGELRGLSFLKQEQNCCAKQELPPHCAAHSTDAASDEGPLDYCDNMQFSAEAPDDAIKSLRVEKIQQDQLVPPFVAAYLVALLQPAEGAENTNFNAYPPPVTKRDIPVLVQSFLL